MSSSPAPAHPAPAYVPLSRAAHGGKRLNRTPGYAFSSSQIMVPLVAPELPRAAGGGMPVAFARAGAAFLPVAVLGIEPGRNLFVNMAGQWLADYVPAALRSRPFAMGRQEGNLVLCVDENSTELTDGEEGEPLFAEDGKPAALLTRTMTFLQEMERGRALTARACEALARHQCIVPLEFTVGEAPGGGRRLEGLFQVDRGVLEKLGDEAFLELRKAGALELAYSQLVSLHKLPLLGKLAALRADEEARQAQVAAGAALFDKDGTFGFDALR
jgi:hypothetical protein